MKLITFAVPCYNSAEYMSHCIESLLPGKEDVEIIIINDGSKDNTLKIAKEYEKKYPNMIKVVDKENGGHGSGVNKGLELATGLFYKVVDSDDWVEEKSLKKIIAQIKKFQIENQTIDLLIANYVYEKEGNRKVIDYKKRIPENKIFTWDDVKIFPIGEYLLMHSVFYRTKFLQETKIKLPEHTFYVDNIFVYYPLPKVKNMFYINVDFYRYFIGREDQSVNESIMIKRIDQQILVTKSMIDFFNPYDYQTKSKKLTYYLIHYLSMMMTICTILLKVENTNISKAKQKEIWEYLKKKNKPIYFKIRFHSLATLTKLPRFLAIPGYHLAQKIYKFN